jgi:predicted GNAT superfamily acetyltransferase
MRSTLYFLIPFFLLACNSNKIPPEEAAKKFMADLDFGKAGASCTQSDTNNDGYVTCTVSLDRGSDLTPLLVTISCAPIGAPTGGCKAAQDVMNTLMQSKAIIHKPIATVTASASTSAP